MVAEWASSKFQAGGESVGRSRRHWVSLSVTLNEWGALPGSWQAVEAAHTPACLPACQFAALMLPAVECRCSGASRPKFRLGVGGGEPDLELASARLPLSDAGQLWLPSMRPAMAPAWFCPHGNNSSSGRWLDLKGAAAEALEMGLQWWGSS